MKKVFFFFLVSLFSFSPFSVFASSGVFLGSSVTNSIATTYTYTSFPFGTAASDRYIVCRAGSTWQAGGIMTSATIGGVTASIVVHAHGNSGEQDGDIFIAAVPTGTSGTIAMTYAGSQARNGLGCDAMYGISSATPYGSGSDADVTGNTPSVTFAVPASGWIVGGSHSEDNSCSTASWTNLTEDYDTQSGGTSAYFTGASATSSSANPSFVASVTYSGTCHKTLVVASFEFGSTPTPSDSRTALSRFATSTCSGTPEVCVFQYEPEITTLDFLTVSGVGIFLLAFPVWAFFFSGLRKRLLGKDILWQ